MIRIVEYKPDWVIQALKDGKKPFFVQMPINNYHRQGITSILGLGTAVERSRTGHKMSQKFVNKLKQTSTGKHLFINHDPNQIAGKITGIKEGKPDEILPIAELLSPHENPIVDAPRAKVEHWLKNDVQLGLSFGGTADDVKIVKESDGSFTYDVQDGELMEWSVTPINAVKRSDGSVQDNSNECPGGICQQIATQIKDGPILPELTDLKQDTKLTQSSGYVLNQTAYDNAVTLINDGNIDLNTPWNAGVYSNHSIDDNCCLGINPTGNVYDDNCMYQIIVDNIVYKQAIIQVAAEAPAGSDIYNAADELLELIYSMELPEEESEEDSNLNIDQNKGSEIMAEDNEIKELKQLVLKQNKTIQGLLDEREAEKQAKIKEAKELELKQEQEARDAELVKTMSEAAGEVLAEQMLEFTQGLMKNREGVVQNSTVPKEVEESTEQESEKINIRDGVKYPAVWMGQVVKGGKTPNEFFGIKSEYV